MCVTIVVLGNKQIPTQTNRKRDVIRMSRRVMTSGLWNIEIPERDGDKITRIKKEWYWLSLKNKAVWQQKTENGYITWARIGFTTADVRKYATDLRDVWNGSLIPDTDKGSWNQAIEAAGDVPQYVMNGASHMDGSANDSDADAGWLIETPNLVSRPIEEPTEDEDEAVTAAFLGCKPDEVKAITQEFAKIPTTTVTEPPKISVKSTVVPVGSNTCAELQAMGVKPRRFGKLHHRVAYVAATKNNVVIGWKQGYKRGSDKQEEQRLLDYLKSFGVMELAV